MCLAFVVMISILQIFIQFPFRSYENLEGQTIQISGQVYSKQIKNDKKIISLKNIQGKNIAPNEKVQVLCYLEEDSFPYIGSTILIEGKVQPFPKATNPGEFNQQGYYQVLDMNFRLNNSKILKIGRNYNYHGELLYQIKERIKSIVDKGLPEKEAGILNAMMLGEKGFLDEEIKSLYQRSGISHVLAISGLHITLLGMGVYKLLRKCSLSITLSSILSIFLMYEYGIMTGFGTSTARAIFMFTIHLVGQIIGRTYDLITAMAIACVLLLCVQPLYLRHSGFLLSFGAIMGIALVNSSIQKWIPDLLLKGKIVKKIVQGFCSSISITLTTLPILLSSFYEYPIYSTFLNLFIIPLMTILFLFAVLGIAVGLVSQTGAYLLFFPCNIILIIYEKAALLIEKLPYGKWITGKPEPWQIVCYYCLLFVTICLIEFYRSSFRKKSMIVLLVGIALLCGTFGKKLTITMLDIGQGDALVIQTAQGQTVMIDGGSSSKKKIGMYQMIPFLKYSGISSVDYLFISHMDSDHISGIVELMESVNEHGIKLKNLVVSQYAIRDDAYSNVIRMAKEKEITILGMKGGDSLLLGEIELNCIYPYEGEVYENNNSSSMVLELLSENFSGIFMGDLEENKERQVLDTLKSKNVQKEEYDLLKVSHHGSNNSSAAYFLEYIRPSLSIISCGRKNRYGHPGKDTLERLKQVNSKVMVTAEEGAIQIEILENGKKMSIKSYGK